MLVSGYNADSRTIPDGAPVSGKYNRLQLDRVVLAGGSVLAAGLAKSGAVPKGVVNISTEGFVDMASWQAIIGTRYLTVGGTYRLSSQLGKLTTAGSGQLIGLAVSKQQLSLQIGLGSSGTSTTVSTSTDGLASLVDLAGEAAARIAGDNALAASIAAEIIARIAGDAALQAQIAAITPHEVSCGTVIIGNGVDSGIVSGLALEFTPSRVVLTVKRPSGALNLWANVIGPITADGFSYTLNGLTDSADYVLFYACVPPLVSRGHPMPLTVNGFPMFLGSVLIGNGVETTSVTGLSLSSIPTQAFVTVRKPSGGFNIYGTISGDLTTDGFDVDLSALTDSGGYILDYLIAPVPALDIVPLSNGVDSGSVTELNLGYTPSGVLLTVLSPVGGLQLFASTVGTPTTDGFDFELSGLTDSADYKLEYILLNEPSIDGGGA